MKKLKSETKKALIVTDKQLDVIKEEHITHDNIVGMKIGEWTVLKRVADRVLKNGKRYPTYQCLCSCGNIKNVDYFNLRNHKTKSCGCLFERNSHYKEPLYQRWLDMKSRCNCPNNTEYSNYGGRGISVIEEWNNDYFAFKNWALQNGFSEELTLDRIDVNGNYEPQNCRWITFIDQQNNRRNNRKVTYHGQTKTVCQWSRELGIHPATLVHRLNYWNDVEKAFTESVRKEFGHEKSYCN